MAKLVFGLQQSLDGYVDHMALGRPGPALFAHSNAHVRALAGVIYGRRTYEIMQYWDDDKPGWDREAHDFALVWRAKPKWVVSRTSNAVGPNATLVKDDIGAVIAGLKSRMTGEIDVAGPDLARSLADLGLVDEYRLILRPVVLGHGTPFFAGPRPPLRLVSTDVIGEEAVILSYSPA